MERVEAQEKELRRLSALLVEHQAILRSSPERPCQESPQASPPQDLAQLRHEVIDQLPSTMNTFWGAATRTGQVHDLARPLTVRRDTFEDILTDVEIPTTPEVGLVCWYGNFNTHSKAHGISGGEGPHIDASWVPLYSQGLFDSPELYTYLYKECFSWSFEVAAMEFCKLREPKVAKLKGGYSFNASLVYQSWLKDIQVYVLEHCLAQWEAIQLGKDYTSECAQLEVEYYLGLTPKSKQSFQGLLDHLSLAFQSCKTVSSLIADFYNWSQKPVRLRICLQMSCKYWFEKL